MAIVLVFRLLRDLLVKLLHDLTVALSRGRQHLVKLIVVVSREARAVHPSSASVSDASAHVGSLRTMVFIAIHANCRVAQFICIKSSLIFGNFLEGTSIAQLVGVHQITIDMGESSSD